MKRAILDAILAARASRRALVMLTWLDGSRQELLEPSERTLGRSLQDAAMTALLSDQASTCEADGAAIFVQPLNPPLRLVIVGAVHIGQHLSVMARSAGYDVTIVDPRTAFATIERFPGVDLRHEWPDAALERIGLDSRTAVVTLTHDPKLDDPALVTALDSAAFYIGSLGSRRTHAQRLVRLREAGIGEDSLQRVHGPVGLDLGARSPAEIAISILAQMVGQLRGPA